MSLTPMSLGTALALIVLGAGGVSTTGPEVWPLRPLVGPSARARLLRTFLTFTAAAVVAADLAEEVVGRLTAGSTALISTLADIACVILAAFASSRLAVSIGGRTDPAEAERAQAQEAQRQSEFQYWGLVESLNGIVAEWGTDLRLAFVNELGLRFFG